MLQRNPLASWTTYDVNLATDLLTGPFDFTRPTPPRSAHEQRPNLALRRKINKFAQTIDLDHWDRLRVIGAQRGLDTTNIDRHPRLSDSTRAA